MKFDLLKRSLSLLLVICTLLGACSFSSFATDNDTQIVVDTIEETKGAATVTNAIGAVITGRDHEEYTVGFEEDFYLGATDLAAVEEESSVDWDEFRAYIINAYESLEEEIDISQFNIVHYVYNEDGEIVDLHDDYRMLLQILGYELIQFLAPRYSYGSKGNLIDHIHPFYPYSSVKERNMMWAELEAAADELLEGIEGNQELSDLEKALLIHDRLVLTSLYDEENVNKYLLGTGEIPINSSSAYGILVNGIGVCQGFAQAYDYLLERVGVESQSYPSGDHVWNTVTINGSKFYADVTWDVSSKGVSGRVRHDYFLCSSEIFGHPDYYFESLTDTTYDNAIWRDSASAFILLNGEIYYVNDKDKAIKTFKENSLVKDISDIYWENTRLTSDGSYLYYSSKDTIYRFDPVNKVTEEFLKVDFQHYGDDGDPAAIYGLTYKDECIIYEESIPGFWYINQVSVGINGCGDNLTWTYQNGVLTISGTGDMYDYIDSAVDDDAEPAPWSIYSDDIKAVVIEDGVTSIGAFTFGSFPNLTSLTIGDSVKSIGDYTFLGCPLTSVKLPSSLESIGAHAFSCTDLETVDTTDVKNLTTIGTRAFESCSSLTEITLPGSITSIGDAIFYKESYYPVIKVTCPAGSKIAELIDNGWQCGVLVLSDSVASGKCGSNLTWGVSKEGILYIYGTGDMYDYEDFEVDENNTAPWYELRDTIETVIIGNSVTHIGKTAFCNLPKLTNVTIGNGVKTIGTASFASCTSLTSIEIPGSVVSIGNTAFNGCSSLVNITLNEGLKTIGRSAFSSCALEEVYIPDGVTTIGDYTFSNCNDLESIRIPDSVVDIGHRIFYYTEFSNLDVTVICSMGSYAHSYAKGQGVSCQLLMNITTRNYTINIPGADDISTIRYASGVHETASSIKAADDYYGMSAAKIAKYVKDGIFAYEMPDGGTYTFHIKYADGTEYIKVVDVTNMTQSVVVDGVGITLNNLYGVKDFFIAKGEWNSYSEIKANGYVVRVTEAKINGAKKYTYSVKEPGTYTVLVRYADAERADYAIKPVVVDVATPTYTVNGLQITIGNLNGVKAIRTAYGKYETVSEIKKADGYRTFTQSVIKGSDEYTIQYRESGTVTVAVQYTNGYTDIVQLEVAQKQSTMVQEGNTVTFGNLEGLHLLRYAEGEYETANQIKNASGSKYLKADAIDENGNVVVTLDKPGTYTFCVQYVEGSYNYYTVTVE